MVINLERFGQRLIKSRAHVPVELKKKIVSLGNCALSVVSLSGLDRQGQCLEAEL